MIKNRKEVLVSIPCQENILKYPRNDRYNVTLCYELALQADLQKKVLRG